MEEQLVALLSEIVPDVAWGGLGEGLGLPRLVLHNVSGREILRLNAHPGRLKGRVQIDCYAGTSFDALQLSRKVRALLSGYAEQKISFVALEGIRDGRDGSDGDAVPRVTLDFAVHYKC